MDGIILTKSDWEEISAALSSKEWDLERGIYFIPLSNGTPEEKREYLESEKRKIKEWAQQLARIRLKIDGEEGDGKHAARVGVLAAKS